MKTVLVVDPSDDDRFIACSVLHYAGYAVEQARAAGEALALARGGVDAIVFALALRDVSCAEFVQRLKDDPATTRIPVVVASKYWDVLPKHASALGVAAKIQKPVTSCDLAQLIAELIGPPAPAERGRTEAPDA